jgi:Cro/C1-type HTH DNA-binding domain
MSPPPWVATHSRPASSLSMSVMGYGATLALRQSALTTAPRSGSMRASQPDHVPAHRRPCQSVRSPRLNSCGSPPPVSDWRGAACLHVRSGLPAAAHRLAPQVLPGPVSCSPAGQAGHRLVRETTSRIDLPTLAAFCAALGCEPPGTSSPMNRPSASWSRSARPRRGIHL